jgi:hypothetical protein
MGSHLVGFEEPAAGAVGQAFEDRVGGAAMGHEVTVVNTKIYRRDPIAFPGSPKIPVANVGGGRPTEDVLCTAAPEGAATCQTPSKRGNPVRVGDGSATVSGYRLPGRKTATARFAVWEGGSED